jgi:hypothetical protein
MSNYVAVTKKIPLGATHGGKTEITFEIQSFDTLQEQIAFFGSEDELRKRVNKMVEKSAIQNAYVKLTTEGPKTAPGAELDKLIEKAKSSAKNYAPQADVGVTQADLVQNAKSILQDEAKYANMSAAEIIAILRGNQS